MHFSTLPLLVFSHCSCWSSSPFFLSLITILVFYMYVPTPYFPPQLHNALSQSSSFSSSFHDLLIFFILNYYILLFLTLLPFFLLPLHLFFILFVHLLMYFSHSLTCLSPPHPHPTFPCFSLFLFFMALQ